MHAHGVQPEQLHALVDQAWADPCHRTMMVPVTHDDPRAFYAEAL